jgi:hypothetical protein
MRARPPPYRSLRTTNRLSVFLPLTQRPPPDCLRLPVSCRVPHVLQRRVVLLVKFSNLDEAIELAKVSAFEGRVRLSPQHCFARFPAAVGGGRQTVGRGRRRRRYFRCRCRRRHFSDAVIVLQEVV